MLCARPRAGLCIRQLRILGGQWRAAPASRAVMASATASFQGGTVSELESWLSSHGVDTSQYGRGHAKPLSLLLDEVADGETTLALVGGAPLRHVSVVNVTVRGAGGRSLVEARQVLPSGAVRPREMPLSEKMLPGEAWRAAVARGVAEELGAVLPAGHVLTLEEETYREEVEEKESQSYPGLRSRYVCHRVDVRIEGLPDGDFVTAEERADGALQHCWEWR